VLQILRVYHHARRRLEHSDPPTLISGSRTLGSIGHREKPARGRGIASG
jgi:hypothetical protein